VAIPDGEKVSEYVYWIVSTQYNILCRNDPVNVHPSRSYYERDGWTDGQIDRQTDTARQCRPRLSITLRSKQHAKGYFLWIR